MQDNLLHPLLTVREAMTFSINLKIGKELNEDEKETRVFFLIIHSYSQI